MKYSIAVFLAVVALVSSCKESEEPSEPTPVDLLTIDIEEGTTGYTEIWFVVWDEDGKQLVSQKYTEGERMTLTTTETIPNNKITLGYFRYRDNPDFGTDQYYVSIYTDITPGLVVDRNNVSGIISPGQFKVVMSNVPANKDLKVSCKIGSTYADPEYNEENGTTTYTMKLLPGATKYILVYEGQPTRYQEINNVNVGDEIELDASEFKSFDHTFSLNLPTDYTALQLTFRGLESGQDIREIGYELASDDVFDEYAEYSLGYPSYTNKFKLDLTVNNGGKQVRYTKNGALPGTIIWPDVSDYVVNSFDPATFSVSAAVPVNFVQGSWSKTGEGIIQLLTIVSPTLTPKIRDVPAEILAAHPNFDMLKKDDYTYADAFFFMNGYQSYSDYVDQWLLSYTVREVESMYVQVSDH